MMKEMTHNEFYGVGAAHAGRAFDRDDEGLVTIDKYEKDGKKYERHLSAKGEKFFEVEEAEQVEEGEAATDAPEKTDKRKKK